MKTPTFFRSVLLGAVVVGSALLPGLAVAQPILRAATDVSGSHGTAADARRGYSGSAVATSRLGGGSLDVARQSLHLGQRALPDGSASWSLLGAVALGKRRRPVGLFSYDGHWQNGPAPQPVVMAPPQPVYQPPQPCISRHRRW